MKEENKKTQEQINFAQLLKELAETQTTLAKIDAQLAIREGQEQIKGVIDSTKTNLEQQAKKFGANLKQIEEDYRNGNIDKKGIIEEYKESLENINGVYQELMQDVLERKAQLEEDEQETMLEQKQNKIETKAARKEYERKEKTLRTEIVTATKEGNLETAQQKIEELQELTDNNPVNSLKAYNKELQERRTEIRKLIEDLEKEYDKFKEERKETIEKITEEKNNKLATISKQNIFQKIMGSIFNKFNGTKKFTKTVMGQLQSKITTIKNENIPQIKQNISEKRKEFSEKVKNARTNIEKNVHAKVEEYALKLAQTQQKSVEAVKNMKEAVVGKATKFGQNIIEGKDNIVNGAKDKIETATIYGMEAKDFVKDKIETATIYGMEAKDFVKDKIETATIYGMEAKDFVKDKIETATIYGMEAKDAIANRKDAIINGVKERKTAFVQGAIGTKDAVVQGVKDTREAAKTKIENAKNSVVTHVTSTVDKGKRTFKSVILKGHETKMNFIQKVQNRLAEKQAEIDKKMQMLNPDKENENQEPAR